MALLSPSVSDCSTVPHARLHRVSSVERLPPLPLLAGGLMLLAPLRAGANPRLSIRSTRTHAAHARVSDAVGRGRPSRRFRCVRVYSTCTFEGRKVPSV